MSEQEQQTTPDEPEDVTPAPEPLPKKLSEVRQEVIDKASELVQQLGYPASDAETKRVEAVTSVVGNLVDVAVRIEHTIRFRQQSIPSVEAGGMTRGPETPPKPKKQKKAKKK